MLIDLPGAPQPRAKGKGREGIKPFPFVGILGVSAFKAQCLNALGLEASADLMDVSARPTSKTKS